MNFIPFQKYLDSSLNLDLDPIAGLADLLEETDIFPYSQIPNFPMSVSKSYIVLDILFPSNHNIHKSSSGHCFWASETL